MQIAEDWAVRQIENREARQLRRRLKYEVRRWKPMIINAATRFGLTHWLRKEGQPGALQTIMTGRGAREKIEILEVRCGPHAHYMRIDPLCLPMFVAINDFRNPELLENLSAAVQRDVEFEGDPFKGYWVIINRDEASHQIPRFVPYSDIWGLIHQADKSARENGNRRKPPLYYVAGVGRNGKVIAGNLEDAPHILIAGTTGGGKSVAMNQILTTLIARNSPEMLRLFLFDFKGGVELYQYSTVPHLEAFITEPEDTFATLVRIRREIRDRLKLMKGRARKLSEYNRQVERQENGVPLAYWVIAVDELTEIMLAASMAVDDLLDPEETENKKPQFTKHAQGSIKNGLIRLIQLGRACGIHFILTTQYPTTRTIDGHIKYNCAVKFAFSCGSNQHSISVIDTGEAMGLSPEGRAIYFDHGRRTEIQGPLITMRQVNSVVRQVSEQQDRPIEKPRDFVELLRFARDELGLSLSIRRLYQEFGEPGRGTFAKHEIQTYLQELDSENIVLDGQTYRTETYQDRRGRSLVPMS